MTDTTRLDRELADALGLAQAVRAAAAAAREHPDASGKLAQRLAQVEDDVAQMQERVNEAVVASPRKRAVLTARARRLRDAEATAREDRPTDADALDAMQALVAETAYAAAQWRVVRRLAKAFGAAEIRKLAKWAQPLAEQHLELALEGVDKVAKRQADALKDPD
jgi:hypothetical protein